MSIRSISCSGKLKFETREVHSDAEKLLLNKLSMIKCTNDYLKLLKLFYGFFAPLETQVRKHINEEALADILKRGNTKKIMEDIEILGGDKAMVEASSLPHVSNVLQAFGVMYVMEGSTLGGQIITRMLRDNRNIKVSKNGLSFFEGYKENTLTMWKSFTSRLDNSFQTDEQVNEIVSTAKETFIKMKEWILTN